MTEEARAKCGHEWRPIETAPRDQYILLCGYLDGPHDPRIKLGYWWSEDHCWRIDGASWRPVFWMPLPSPPTDSGEGVA